MSRKTRLVLIFETGQYLPSGDTDDQTACAFVVCRLADGKLKIRCTAAKTANLMATNGRFRVIIEHRRRNGFALLTGEADPQRL